MKKEKELARKQSDIKTCLPVYSITGSLNITEWKPESPGNEFLLQQK